MLCFVHQQFADRRHNRKAALQRQPVADLIRQSDISSLRKLKERQSYLGYQRLTGLEQMYEALRTLASADGWWDRVTRRCVLTPHAGEVARLRSGSGHVAADDGDLTDDDDARAAAASAAAREWRQVVVLKGARTVIAAPDGSIAIAPFENPAMASGGTGDVLAGTIGALLAQGLAPFDAARLGVYLHGVAGELVAERIGDAGLLASDLPDALPMGRKRLAQLAERQRSGRRLGFGHHHGYRSWRGLVLV